MLGEGRVRELGDEHRRHAVERRAALLGDRRERRLRLERGRRDDHARAVGHRAEVAHDHAEAVVEGHRDADAVLGPVAARGADEVAVVEDVAVRERRALRGAGRAARVLDVDRVAGGERGLARRQRVRPGLAGAREQRVPLGAPEPEHVGQCGQLRADLLDHRDVVRRLERARGDQRPAAGLGERVAQLGRPVRRVDVDEHRADPRGGELRQHPLGAVRRPDPDPVARLDAEREQRAGEPVGLRVELGVAEADALVARDERLAAAVLGRHAPERGADRLLEQRRLGRPGGVTRRHRFLPRVVLVRDHTARRDDRPRLRRVHPDLPAAGGGGALVVEAVGPPAAELELPHPARPAEHRGDPPVRPAERVLDRRERPRAVRRRGERA